jgi:hypothetical protein
VIPLLITQSKMSHLENPSEYFVSIILAS